ncbi:MAG TPA: DUF255 domain-containing protein [Flavobacteriales bacterium]|nr:DUF255 domain-containing protein [Flavobacteriales bacterium]
MLRKYLLTVVLLVIGLTASFAQIFEPVKWDYAVRDLGNSEYELVFKATIDDNWHLYSQFIDDGGPIPTSFGFDSIPELELIGPVEEHGELETDFDPNFEMKLKWFSHEAEFVQKVKINADNLKFNGYYEFMTCDDKRCLPPEYVEMEFKLGADGMTITERELEPVGPVDTDSSESGNPFVNAKVDLTNPVNDCGEKREEKTLWGIFILGLIGGFIALLTPCVFPMIPLTVSYFTKGSGDKKQGVYRSIMYGTFIMVIYFLLSMPFHLLPDIDPEVLNRISTNTWLNLAFFAIFIIFAISFFGYFEIGLPSKWANKADTASDVGGIIGIFFMALTLAIVSFSCTGPILGTLLAGTLSSEGAGVINMLGMDLQLVAVKLSVGMTGFGLALGLPFALFAAFPGWLQSLPQSGSWLNTVKVVLGFVEVALAIKFFSNADLVEQWGVLKRETFFALWFLTSIGLGLYFFQRIKFPHDSPGRKVSRSNLVFGAVTIAFAIYLLPGMWAGKSWNHNALSGFPPPKYYSYFAHEHEIKVFTDYDEGFAYARKVNRPVMIDFTGWACVNCRKMEDNVWTEDSIKKILNDKYVVISLYVDEKTVLPEDEQQVIEVPTSDGGTKLKKLRTVGDRWSTLETLTFASNTQPYYILLNTDETLLANPVGYSYAQDLKRYSDYLYCGLDAFEKLQAEQNSGGGFIIY